MEPERKLKLHFLSNAFKNLEYTDWIGVLLHKSRDVQKSWCLKKDIDYIP